MDEKTKEALNKAKELEEEHVPTFDEIREDEEDFENEDDEMKKIFDEDDDDEE